MLRGVPSARWGSKRPGQPFPFLAVAEERPDRRELGCLRRCLQRLADPVAMGGGALRVIADVHPVHCGDPGGAGMPRPGGRVGCLGMFGLQPAPGLEQRGPDAAADPGCERGSGMPPVCPLRPFGRAAGGPVWTAASARSWRITEAQVSHGSLHRVQRVQPQAWKELLAADPVEQPGAQVLQVRAAVQQENLAGDHRQQRVVLAAEPVSPPGEHRADAADLAVYPVAAENPPGQDEAVEPAKLAEGGKTAEQEGVRCQVGTDRIISPCGSSFAESVLVTADDSGPLLFCPCPVRPAGLRAPQQHYRARIGHRPAAMRRGWRLQRGGGVIQGPQQPPDRLPPSGGQVAAGQAAQVVHPEIGNGRCLSSPDGWRGVIAPRVDRPAPAPVTSSRQHSQRRAHAGTSGTASSPAQASIRTRQAWMWSMPLLSLLARSRPDR